MQVVPAWGNETVVGLSSLSIHIGQLHFKISPSVFIPYQPFATVKQIYVIAKTIAIAVIRPFQESVNIGELSGRSSKRNHFLSQW